MKTCFFLAALLLAGCGGSAGGDAGSDAGSAAAMAAGAPATLAAAPIGVPDASFSAARSLLGRDADGTPVPDAALALAEGAAPRPLD